MTSKETAKMLLEANCKELVVVGRVIDAISAMEDTVIQGRVSVGGATMFPSVEIDQHLLFRALAAHFHQVEAMITALNNELSK